MEERCGYLRLLQFNLQGLKGDTGFKGERGQMGAALIGHKGEHGIRGTKGDKGAPTPQHLTSNGSSTIVWGTPGGQGERVSFIYPHGTLTVQ